MAVKLNKSNKKYLIFAFFCLVIGLIGFLTGFLLNYDDDSNRTTSDIIGQQVAEIGELAAIEYHYTNMGKFENQIDFYGWPVPLTKKSFIVSYDGEIKAGINVAAADVSLSGKEIVITCPAPEILTHVIDMESITVFDETRNIFNPISITDYQRFSLDQQAAIETKVIEEGLLAEAKTRAEQALLRLLALDDEYSIVFKWLE